MTDSSIPSDASVVVAAWPGLDLSMLLGDDMTLGRSRRLNEQRFTLDTADNRLARADIVVSRLDGRWRIRCGGYGSREFEGEEPASELLDALAGVSRGAPLLVASRVTRQGRVLPVIMNDKDDGPVPVGHVRDEDVSALDGRRVVSRQRYITVEGTKGLVAQVHRALAVTGMERRAMKSLPDTTPLGPPDPLPWPLEDRPLAGTVVQRALVRSASKLLAHDPVVRLDLHLEGVHQMRVAIRRLRSDLKTFGDLVGPLSEGFVDDLRWIAALLGSVRDLDVLHGSLNTTIGRLDATDVRSTNSLMKRLGRQREAAMAPLEAALTSARYHELITAIVALAERPPLHDDAEGTAADVLVPRARKSWKRLRRAASAAGDRDAPTEAVHAMRLRAKQFRYAVDALVEVEPDAKRHARLVGRLQDVLGEFNDAANAEAWLRDQAAHEDDARRSFVLGQLVMLERARADERRAAAVDVWRPVHKSDATNWLDG